jgi:hypothetical protein
MPLEGSCHCKSIRFRVEASGPYPFVRCYCSICRKTAGGGGYAINLGARNDTLRVEGAENLRVYNAKLYDEGDEGEVPASEAERNFCGLCGSFLWLFSPSYPNLVHPFASAVDTQLPKPSERFHTMLDSAAPWVESPTNRTRDTSRNTRTRRWKTGTAATASSVKGIWRAADAGKACPRCASTPRERLVEARVRVRFHRPLTLLVPHALRDGIASTRSSSLLVPPHFPAERPRYQRTVSRIACLSGVAWPPKALAKSEWSTRKGSSNS